METRLPENPRGADWTTVIRVASSAPPLVNRRHFITSLVQHSPLLAALSPRLLRAAEPAAAPTESLPPIRQITRGPRFHWFGYYDKFQFSADNRFVLGNEVEFEGRSPRAEDRIRVGMVDLQEGDRWIELGSTCAWN